MIAIIRIAGQVEIRKKIEETLSRLKLKRKYSCIIIDEKDKVKVGMLKKVYPYVAFGEIDKQTLIRLIEKRGQTIKKAGAKEKMKTKIDAKRIADEIEKGEKPEDSGIKGFFRLHSPRGGLKSSKKFFPRGVLGNHKKEINKLIEKML